MGRSVPAVLAALLFGCSSSVKTPGKDGEMKTLVIRWQRLVDENGTTCPRCAATQEEVRKAYRSLKGSLAALGIEVILEEGALAPAGFAEDALQSNRIWIGDTPLEDWLAAEAAQSPCCGACGDQECRTVTADGLTYEAIPAELVVKAGLLAAGQLVATGPTAPCCRGEAQAKRPANDCCPEAVGGPPRCCE